MKNTRVTAQATSKMDQYLRRKHRVNTVIKTHHADYRLIANKSNKYVVAQVVDQSGKIVAHISDKALKSKTKTEGAIKTGEALAKMLLEKGIKQVVFDRNGYRFH